MAPLEQLLSRSHDFSEMLLAELQQCSEFAGSDREDAAFAAAELVFEHAVAVRVLFEVGTASSAVVLLRAQFEAMLRAAWLLYAANDAQVAKMAAPLTLEAAADAKNIHGADEMLKALERATALNPGLRGLVLPLKELKDSGWAAMNAFAHSGLHALARTREGFPDKLATDVVKLSNGVLQMAARLLAHLGNSPGALQRIGPATSPTPTCCRRSSRQQTRPEALGCRCRIRACPPTSECRSPSLARTCGCISTRWSRTMASTWCWTTTCRSSTSWRA
ncbi:DUF6988 family protein [Roseateles sp. NT4]|uniref:DUF6988 family protein n=1 Tax=Roseateles sp. NT4 TaxID=3453715 RepID=UPI003EEDFB4C